MKFINVNGKLLKHDKAFVKTDDHSYRYGDGLFETMKIKEGKILLAELHFERLFKSLAILKIQIPRRFSKDILEKGIINLSKKNNCKEAARVRLSISRGNGGLYDADDKLQYVIECGPLPGTMNKLNKKGLLIGVFPSAKKSCDVFSNLKSASHLPYVMGALFSKEKKLDDCLIMNMYSRICDSTIANLFWVKGKIIFTPPLSEGCIAGVMRAHILEGLKALKYNVREKNCEIKDLENADEIFLTNAIRGIRWVRAFRNREYINSETKKIWSTLFQLQK